MLTRDVLNRPRPDALAEPGQAPPAARGTPSARRDLVWVSGMPPGAALFLHLIGPAEYGPDAAGTIPLTPVSWLTLLDAVPLAACFSEALAEDGQLLPALASFQTAAFALEQARATSRHSNRRRRPATPVQPIRLAEGGWRRRCRKRCGSSDTAQESLSSFIRVRAVPNPLLAWMTFWMRPAFVPARCSSSWKANGGSATAIRCWPFERRTVGP